MNVGVESKPHDNSQERDGGDGKIGQQSFGAAEAGIHQNSKITNFLGNFMKGHGNGGNNPQSGIGDESGGDDEAVDKVMNTVSDQVHITESVNVTMAMVAVAPMEYLFDDWLSKII